MILHFEHFSRIVILYLLYFETIQLKKEITVKFSLSMMCFDIVSQLMRIKIKREISL